MLRSRRLLPKLSASTAGKGLVPFLDQLILLENAQLGSHLAWLSVNGESVDFFGNAGVMALWRLEPKGGITDLVTVVDGASFSPVGPGTDKS
jgi:hypothetical protein